MPNVNNYFLTTSLWLKSFDYDAYYISAGAYKNFQNKPNAQLTN